MYPTIAAAICFSSWSRKNCIRLRITGLPTHLLKVVTAFAASQIHSRLLPKPCARSPQMLRKSKRRLQALAPAASHQHPPHHAAFFWAAFQWHNRLPALFHGSLSTSGCNFSLSAQFSSQRLQKLDFLGSTFQCGRGICICLGITFSHECNWLGVSGRGLDCFGPLFALRSVGADSVRFPQFPPLAMMILLRCAKIGARLSQNDRCRITTLRLHMQVGKPLIAYQRTTAHNLDAGNR